MRVRQTVFGSPAANGESCHRIYATACFECAQEGDPSYKLFAEERDGILSSLKRRAVIMEVIHTPSTSSAQTSVRHLNHMPPHSAETFSADGAAEEPFRQTGSSCVCYAVRRKR